MEKLTKEHFNKELLAFINDSPTAFHAVKNIEKELASAGFERLVESEQWKVKRAGKYFITRNASSIIAFSTGPDDSSGFRIMSAHTDSPSLKIKPDPLYMEGPYFQLGVEVYGGALLKTWFDRELSIAGRVTFLDSKDNISSALVDFKKPIAIIPSLASHLSANAAPFNAQKELSVIIGQKHGRKTVDFKELLKEQIKRSADVKTVLDHELFLYDCAPAAFFGLANEFVAGSRLDNLISCFICLKAAQKSGDGSDYMIALNDHEEAGSTSFHGAGGSFLRDVLSRLYTSSGERQRITSSSIILSLDNAHGAHPNYPETHEARHRVEINNGPAIKANASQRYSTNSETAAEFRAIALKLGVNIQNFVMRNDMPCGTTTGPINSAATGIPALDAGVPSLAMHSIREMAGTADAHALFKIGLEFLKGRQVPLKE
ncbi:MAG: M18 family aminopeptidase [Leptospirales bacterium]|nr:M18 family aminopeptidase [Leptospirales bacterium]